jgi:CBS-domain-containing membrane protein
MKIKDRFEFKNKGPVLQFKGDVLVSDAVHVMVAKNYGACVIVDKDIHPIGIVSERDLMRKLLDKGLDPKKTKLQDIMSTNLKLGHPEDEIVEWLRQMSNERFRHLPIVDQDGKLIGLVSQGDFVSYTWPDLLSFMKSSAIKSMGTNTQLYALLIGILIYTAVMLWLFKAF